MSKRIALKDLILVDGVDLSTFARSWSAPSEHAREDVSGFNSTGADEFLAGRTTQEATVEFYGSYGSGEVHQTLYPIHRDKDIVWLQIRPDQTAEVSAANPELRGNVQILTYGPGANRGDVEAFSVTFTPADEDGLVWHDYAHT